MGRVWMGRVWMGRGVGVDGWGECGWSVDGSWMDRGRDMDGAWMGRGWDMCGVRGWSVDGAVWRVQVGRVAYVSGACVGAVRARVAWMVAPV